MVDKARLSPEDKEKLEKWASEISAMPNGDLRNQNMREFQMVWNVLKQRVTMPNGQESTILENVLAPFDYVAGLVRTVPGEAALVAKSMKNRLQEKPDDWNGEQAMDRLTSAILPGGELAPPSETYLEKLGAGEGGRLSRADWLPEKLRPKYDSPLDLTGRGTAGFAMDMASGIVPNLLPGAGKTLAGPTAKDLAARSLPKLGAGATAKEWTDELAKLIAKGSEKTHLQKLKKGAKDFSQYVADFIRDPGARGGKSLYDFGLREPNVATQKVAKRPFSDTLIESGSDSFTARGIQNDVEGILRDRTREANLIKNPPAQKLAEQLSLYSPQPWENKLSMPTTTRDDIFNPVFNDKRLLEKGLEVPGRTEQTKAGIEQMKARLRATAEYSDPKNPFQQAKRMADDQAMAEQLVPRVPDLDPLQTAPDVNPMGEPLPAGEPLYKDPAAEVKGFYKIPPQQIGREPGKWVVTERPMPTRTVIDDPGRIPERQPTYKNIEETVKDKTWQEGAPIMSEPRIGVTRFDREVLPYTKADDILEHGTPSYNPEQLDELAASMQALADEAGIYGQPSTFWHPDVASRNQVSANRVEGWIASQAAKNARQAAMNNLDQFSPGAGGNLWKIYKDKASLREGAPYLERKFTVDGSKRGASTGLRSSLQSTSASGRLLGMLDGSGDAMARGVGLYLMSPYQRYVTGPAARSYGVEKVEEMKYGRQNRRSPWQAAKKIGSGR
jgi:hypothetical protein